MTFHRKRNDFLFSVQCLIFLLLFFSSALSRAEEFQCYTFEGCGKGGGRPNAQSAAPTTGSSIRVNPSAVPTEKGFGLEGIYFKSDTDIAIVRGLGRVGAAISPSNSEETFFGPPGLETPEETFERKLEGKKYPKQKVTLATAFDLIKRKGSGLKTYGLKLGLMGRHNYKTKATSAGGGLQALVGPFTLGGSIYNDETQINIPELEDELKPVYKYQVQTYNLGLALSSLLLDYSIMKMESYETKEISTVRLATASLLWKKLLVTASRRDEDSERLNFNYETRLMEVQQNKIEYFGGLQIYATKNLMIGALYNYYLLREFSATATLFF